MKSIIKPLGVSMLLGCATAALAQSSGPKIDRVDVKFVGPASVSELARPFDMSLSAIVQHLKVLEAGGLVRTEKVGRVRTCQIEPAALSAAEQWINQRRTTWEQRFDRLEQYLNETSDDPKDKDQQP